jgi:hypothetical protein
MSLEKEKFYFRLQLVAFVIISALAVFASIGFDAELEKYMPESQPLASIFNKRQSGLSGLFEIAESVGVTCAAWLSPYRELKKKTGMLVIIAPNDSLQDFEAEQILAWVGKGNRLLYLDRFDFKMFRRLLEKIDVEITDGKELTNFPISVNQDKERHPEFSHVSQLHITAENRIKGGKPIVEDRGGALLTELTHGKGKIYLGTVPTFCSNRLLSDRNYWSNFQFIVNIFRAEKCDIIFDEHCHGYSQSDNVFGFLARRTPGLVFCQLLLILALTVWSQSRHFGRLRKADTSRKISSLEYIKGLSNTYRRARANVAVLEIIFQNFKIRLCKNSGISPSETDEQIVEQLKSSTKTTVDKDDDRVLRLFTSVANYMQTKHLTDKQLKEVVVECDAINQIYTLSAASPHKKEMKRT